MRFFYSLIGFLCIYALSACASPTQLPGPTQGLVVETTNSANNPFGSHGATLTQEILGLESAISVTASPPPTSAAQQTALAATLAVPTPTPTRTRLPLQTSDLLYLSKNRLMRWDHFTGFSSLLVENVESFSVSASGRQILLLRPRKIIANGEAQYDVDLMDLESKQILAVLSDISLPQALTISPDGSWLAYIDGTKGGTVLARRTDASADAVELGQCTVFLDLPASSSPDSMHCNEVAWSPDNRQVLWSDAHGIWISSPNSPDAQRLHNTKVQVYDPKGNSTEVSVAFNHLTWSPTGRFALLHIFPSVNGVHWQAVLDTRLGKMADVPDSSELTSQTLSVSWNFDGRLILAHGGNLESSGKPFIKFFEVLPTNNELLVMVKKIELQIEDNLLAEIKENSDQSSCLSWAIQRDENYISVGFSIHNLSTATSQLPTRLLNVSLIDGRSQTLAELPHETSQVIWAPDGSGALILGEPSQVMFLSLKDGSLLDLSPAIGSNPQFFYWLPPAPRRAQ